MEQKKRKKRGRGRSIAAAVVALVLVAAALTALLYRDKLTADSLGSAFGETDGTNNAEPFTYEAGSGQVFAAAGNQLAVASSTGIQLLDAKGRTVAREVFSMDTPAVAGSAKRSLFYDVGGTALRVVDATGTVSQPEGEHMIYSASVNDEGWVVTVTEETGYKAVVHVYNADLQKVYAWHAGSAYVLSAQLSPDCRSLAVLCADADGSRLELFSLSSETPLGSCKVPGELFFDLCWLDKDRIALLSQSRLLLLNAQAEETASYAFGGQFLLDYALDESGFAALLLGEFRSGGDSLLVTVDATGAELGRKSLPQRAVLSISTGENALLMLHADGLELLTRTLTPVNSYTETLGFKEALLRQDGKCLLLSSYSAELIELN